MRQNNDNPAFFPDVAAVLTALRSAGFVISRPSFYRHLQEGRIGRGLDGTFSKRAVELYAEKHLKTLAGRRLRKRDAALADLERVRAAIQAFIVENASDLCAAVGGDPGGIDDMLVVAEAASGRWLPVKRRRARRNMAPIGAIPETENVCNCAQLTMGESNEN